MELEILANGNLRIDDARIIFRNFSGAPTKFNSKGGSRDFALVIPNEEIYDALLRDKNSGGVAWNVKKLDTQDDQDPLMFLKVRVNFDGFRPPNVYLKTDGKKVKLDEESIDILDQVEIQRVDLDIRPFDGDVNGKPFRSAYLQSMCVTQDITDRFADHYED